MVWIYVALGVAVLGVGLLVAYVFVLYRKFVALASELGVGAERLSEVLVLVDQIRIPDRLAQHHDAAFERE